MGTIHCDHCKYSALRKRPAPPPRPPEKGKWQTFPLALGERTQGNFLFGEDTSKLRAMKDYFYSAMF